MELKRYQLDTLKTLRRFFEDARMHGPANAFNDIVNEDEQRKRLEAYRPSYRPHNAMAETPYVCLRLPTGGGKTILAAHAIKAAAETWMDREYPLVLWLVPTKTIRNQTVEALKKAGHPYREALDDAFGGAVRVFDIGDFTTILPHDLRSSCCVVVGTIQTLRVADTEGRKVYAHHELLEPHFTGVPASMPGLELVEGQGTIRYSFANLLHLNQPLMIVDEAQNAVTGLSREMQERVNPSAIIELTATPKGPSNVLHAVSAQEVKDAEMIKLPIVLGEHQTWQQAVTAAIARRAHLAEIASRDRDYIRPIVLFQAEAKNKTVTVDVLKKHLIEDNKIDPRHIAVATGSQRELDGIDLFKVEPPIEYIITVEALKEGWDCPFAYVFCSMANIRSSTAAEQLLGRVLRMPYAKKRAAPALNRAYAELVSPSFMQAANDLRDALVAKLGYEEAEQNIETERPLPEGEGLFGRQVRPLRGASIDLPVSPGLAISVASAAPGKVVADAAGGRITITQFLTPLEANSVRNALAEPDRAAFDVALDTFASENRPLIAPAEAGGSFVVPALVVPVQGVLELADIDVLMENTDWRLSDHSAQLGPAEFEVRQEAQTWEVGVAGGRVSVRHQDAAREGLLEAMVEGWTESGLVQWLDPRVRDANVGQADMIEWLTAAVRHLTGPRAISISVLHQCRHVLMRELKKKIARIKTEVRETAYQRSLFGPEAKPDLDFARGFLFEAGMYDGMPLHRNDRVQFKNHFLGSDKVPAIDGKAGGEEEQCALALDSLGQVRHWVRNVARHPRSFWLSTAGGRFYPDFVAELKDGRLLVVEYKGKHFDAADTHKRAIGERWASVAPDKTVFAWIVKRDAGRDMRGQLERAIEPQA